MECAAPRRRRDGVLLPEGCWRWGWSLPLHHVASSEAVVGASASWWVDCPLLLSGCNQGRVSPCSVMSWAAPRRWRDGFLLPEGCRRWGWSLPLHHGTHSEAVVGSSASWCVGCPLLLSGCNQGRVMSCSVMSWAAPRRRFGDGVLLHEGCRRWGWSLPLHPGTNSEAGRCRSTMAPVLRPLAARLLRGGWIVRCSCQDATRGA